LAFLLYIYTFNADMVFLDSAGSIYLLDVKPKT